MFTYEPMRASMPADTGPATIAEHEVTVDTWALARTERHVAEFALPDGSRFKAVPEEIRYRGDWHTDFAWRGKLEGNSEQGWAVITVRQGHIAGSLTLSGRNNYTLKPGPEPGVVRLLEIDGSVIPECGVEDLPEPELSGATQPASLPPVAPASAGSAPIIDVMVVYTPLARQNAGGHAQIQAQIQAAVDITNDAYANSEVFQRIELVHLQQVTYTGDQSSSNSSDYLDWVQDDPAVANLRDQHHADMVALIFGNQTAVSRAYYMNFPGPGFESRAFSVTAQGSFEEHPYTFAHELGHNMGLHHDPDYGPDPQDASYPWGFGHFFQLSDGTWEKTIMAYINSCPGWTNPNPPWSCDTVPYFSNPNVVKEGGVTGIAGARDNARTLNLTANIIADFRKGNHLYADRFEERGYALSGTIGPPPMTHAESCTELEESLSLYETRLAEKMSRLSENDDDAREAYEEEAAVVVSIREQLAKECL